MKVVERRLARLERLHGAAPIEPARIIWICPEMREPVAAMLVKGGQVTLREPGETVEAFECRAGILPAETRATLPGKMVVPNLRNRRQGAA